MLGNGGGVVKLPRRLSWLKISAGPNLMQALHFVVDVAGSGRIEFASGAGVTLPDGDSRKLLFVYLENDGIVWPIDADAAANYPLSVEMKSSAPKSGGEIRRTEIRLSVLPALQPDMCVTGWRRDGEFMAVDLLLQDIQKLEVPEETGIRIWAEDVTQGREKLAVKDPIAAIHLREKEWRLRLPIPDGPSLYDIAFAQKNWENFYISLKLDPAAADSTPSLTVLSSSNDKRRFVEAPDYGGWISIGPHFPANFRSAPHHAMAVYTSRETLDYFSAHRDFPVGAVFVKESRPLQVLGRPDLETGMLIETGTYLGGSDIDWIYGTVFGRENYAVGKKIFERRPSSCFGCHHNNGWSNVFVMRYKGIREYFEE